MIRQRLAVPVSLAVTALLLTSACSSGSDEASAGAAATTAAGAATEAPKPGADGRLDAPAGADEETKKQYAYTNELAACMKQAGFAYVPYVPVTRPQDAGDADRDYQRAREMRAKYGFGAFAGYVYPGDPAVPGSGVESSRDPNDATYQALTPDQKAAWDLALMGTSDRAQSKQVMLSGKGCMGRTRTKVYGDQAKIDADSKAQADQARLSRQNLNGDPELVRLAQGYASCLRGKGYNVTTNAVTEIRTALQFEWFGKAGQMTKPAVQRDPAPGATATEEPPSLAPDIARAQLTQEIQAALADLDCGKDFRAAYFPKLDKMPGAEGLG